MLNEFVIVYCRLLALDATTFRPTDNFHDCTKSKQKLDVFYIYDMPKGISGECSISLSRTFHPLISIK